MEKLIYSLKGNQNDSSKYYEDVSRFTDKVLNESEYFLGHLIEEFKLYLEKNDLCPIQSSGEYVFELLMIGTFWRVYGAQFSKLSKNSQKLLENLASVRRKHELIQPGVDFLRGILMALVVVPDRGDASNYPDLNLKNFNQLLKFLQAAGEFGQEIKKLKIWMDFLGTKTPETVSKYLSNILVFAEWFETLSKTALGEYTQNVENFLREKYQKRWWRKNVISCGRKQVEYHFSMVGAEIMNREFKEDFEKRPRKILLLPVCMRSKTEAECRAKETNHGLKCVMCSRECNIAILTKMSIQHRFEVYIVSHEASTFSGIAQGNLDEVGIIGVACIPKLIAGGLKSKSLGIPAQCVILDFAGCKRHWQDEDFPTDINVNRLMNLFNIKTQKGLNAK